MGYSFLSVNTMENFKTLASKHHQSRIPADFGSILRCHVAGGSAVATPMTLVRPSLSVGGGSRMRRP